MEEQQAEISRVEIALADELHAERSATASAHQRETAMLNEAERLHMEEVILNAAIVETLQSSEDVKVRKDCTGNPQALQNIFIINSIKYVEYSVIL